MRLGIRDEEPEDRDRVDGISTADLLAQLTAAGIAPGTASALAAMQVTARREQYLRAHPDARPLVLTRDDRVVGRLVVEAVPGRVHVVDLAVAPEARRTGVAREALSRLCERADADGSVVELMVWADNEPALGLYDGLGFRVRAGDDAASGRVAMSRPPHAPARGAGSRTTVEATTMKGSVR